MGSLSLWMGTIKMAPVESLKKIIEGEGTCLAPEKVENWDLGEKKQPFKEYVFF